MSNVPLHYVLSHKIIKLLQQGSNRKSYQDVLIDNTIQQVEIDTKSFHLDGEIFISSADIYDDLSIAAIKLVIRIQKELMMNNPFWECKDKHKSEVRKALAELKRKEIIESIDNTDIYIVSVNKIRKGRPLSVLAAVIEYSERKYAKDRNWRITTADIKRLVSPKTITIAVDDMN